jgi:hypothetical protein
MSGAVGASTGWRITHAVASSAPARATVHAAAAARFRVVLPIGVPRTSIRLFRAIANFMSNLPLVHLEYIDAVSKS